MTQKEFNRDFINSVASNLDAYASNGMLDKPMIREEFNNLTDSYCKDGLITEKQYNNWITPKGALNLAYLKGVANSL